MVVSSSHCEPFELYSSEADIVSLTFLLIGRPL